MRAPRGCWLLLALALLAPGLSEARDRAPRRFRNYKQIARTLKQSEFENAWEGLNRRVGLALGQVDLAFAEALPAAAAAVDALGDAGTGTTVQVAGVDEADLVKTDGTNLYFITQGRLAIVRAARAVPDRGAAEPLELLSLTDIGDASFMPSELHLCGSLLVVVGMRYDFGFLGDPVVFALGAGDAKALRMMPISVCPARTVLQIYDVGEPKAPALVRRLEIEGTHLTSRRVGQYLYVLARAYPLLDAAAGTTRRSPAPGLVPRVADSRKDGALRNLLPGEVSLLPDCYEASYLVVAALDLSRPDGSFVPHAFLGGGNVVYASKENLYVAASSWFWHPIWILAAEQGDDGAAEEESVTLMRFALKGTDVVFAARGSVPGRVLNSFSMDEHEGVFRIATTSYPSLWTDTAETSGVYTLDLDLNPLGSLRGLAPGERLYAARFLGDRGYLITFETIDPLFVIDLKDPRQPRTLGELKMPGYSSYLHPVGDTHLIGLGKDVTLVQTPWSGEEGVPMEGGLRLALFDVRDGTAPAELDVELLGVRGSWSEALYDHHAFLYDAGRRVAAFPCTLREYLEPPPPDAFWMWGDFVFQGLVVYGVEPGEEGAEGPAGRAEAGLEPWGGITHMDDPRTELWDAPWERTILRGLIVGDLLHTVSPGMVKANACVPGLPEVSSLLIPWQEQIIEDPVIQWLDEEQASDFDPEAILDLLDGEVSAQGLLPDGVDFLSSAEELGDLLRQFLEATR